MRKIIPGVVVLLLLGGQLPASVLSIDGFQLSLYTSFEFEYQIDEEGLGDPNGSFDLDQIDLMFSYEKENLRLAVDIVMEHGAVSEDGLGNVELSFGFAEWVFRNFSNFSCATCSIGMISSGSPGRSSLPGNRAESCMTCRIMSGLPSVRDCSTA